MNSCGDIPRHFVKLGNGYLISSAASPPYQVRVTCATPGIVENPEALGKRLTMRFFVLLQKSDVPGLRNFLAPDFQLQRANGLGDTKSSYLKKDLPDIEMFNLRKLHTRMSGSTLTVRYQARVAGSAAGGNYTENYAPRISSFSYCSGQWQLTSHANFDPLDG